MREMIKLFYKHQNQILAELDQAIIAQCEKMGFKLYRENYSGITEVRYLGFEKKESE